MLQSMTGYGHGQFAGEDIVVTIHLKSVNHRHFDANIRLPQELQIFENTIKNALKDKLVRGSLAVTVSFEGTGEMAVRVNEPVAAAYMRAARELQEKFGFENGLSLDSLLRLPDVMSFGNNDPVQSDRLKEKYGAAVNRALDQAIAEITSMRKQEGEQLEKDLRDRALAIGQRVDVIEGAMRSNAQIIYDKLKEEVARLTASVNIDAGRLAQEVAYLAEKSDVTEEVTRLKSHVGQFLGTLESPGEIGKKLDFLLQEMHRETNTILSKTSSVFGEARRAGDLAIEVKAEIEKLREQVQNVI